MFPTWKPARAHRSWGNRHETDVWQQILYYQVNYLIIVLGHTKIVMTSKESHKDKYERSKAFVEGEINRISSYHQSKEAMAYAGITLFGGIAGSASVSNAWPPDWGKYTLLLAVLALYSSMDRISSLSTISTDQASMGRFTCCWL
jgi:hypothetical protein